MKEMRAHISKLLTHQNLNCDDADRRSHSIRITSDMDINCCFYFPFPSTHPLIDIFIAIMSSLPNNAYCIPTLNTVNHFKYERKNTSEKLQKHVVFQGNYQQSIKTN